MSEASLGPKVPHCRVERESLLHPHTPNGAWPIGEPAKGLPYCPLSGDTVPEVKSAENRGAIPVNPGANMKPCSPPATQWAAVTTTLPLNCPLYWLIRRLTSGWERSKLLVKSTTVAVHCGPLSLVSTPTAEGADALGGLTPKTVPARVAARAPAFSVTLVT